MSAATRAGTARERANIAARYIRKGVTHTRAFDDCFEMYDGEAVVYHLLEKAKTDERIRDFATQCGWTSERYPNPALTTTTRSAQ